MDLLPGLTAYVTTLSDSCRKAEFLTTFKRMILKKNNKNKF